MIDTLNAPSEAKLLYSLKSLPAAVEALAFSPDRRLLATASHDGTGRIWDVSGSKPTERAAFRILEGIRSLTFAPSGKSLAAGSGAGTISLFDVSPIAVREYRTLRGAKGSVDAVAFSPDGLLVAGGGEDQTLRIWEPGTGIASEPRNLLPGHTQAIRTIAFAPDGKSLATGSRDSSARVWALNRIRPSQQMSLPHGGEVGTVAYSPDGKTLITSGKDKVIWLWDLTALKATVRTRLPGHSGETRLVLMTPDAETVVSVGAGSDVMNWSPRTGRLRRECTLPPSSATRFALTPDGRYLARGMANGSVEVFRVAEKRAAGVSHHG